MPSDLDEMRKSHAKIQSHPLLGVLLAEAAQGVKEGGCAGRAQLGAKTAGARIHRGHIEDPLVVRLHQAGSAGEQAMPGSQGDLETHQVVRPDKGRRGGKPRGAYGATAAAAAHKMGNRPRDVAALGRSVADAGDRVASASGLARLAAPENVELEPRRRPRKRRNDCGTDPADTGAEALVRPERRRPKSQPAVRRGKSRRSQKKTKCGRGWYGYFCTNSGSISCAKDVPGTLPPNTPPASKEC